MMMNTLAAGGAVLVALQASAFGTGGMLATDAAGKAVAIQSAEN